MLPSKAGISGKVSIISTVKALPYSSTWYVMPVSSLVKAWIWLVVTLSMVIPMAKQLGSEKNILECLQSITRAAWLAIAAALKAAMVSSLDRWEISSILI